MNAMLHDIDGEITLGDTLSNLGKSMKGYDLVLTIISSIISSGIRSKQGKPFFSSQIYLAKAA